MHPAAEQYRALLERVDRWFAGAAERYPGVVPCRAGCSACCHGPFDISIADALLLGEGLKTLSPADRAVVRSRGERLLARMRQQAPAWLAPWDIRDLGETPFDNLAESLADEPCPLLDDQGRCRVYQWRPLVCRLIGLPMMTAEGELLENACPIQDQFPEYARLDPQLFDLGALQDAEVSALEAAAKELRGGVELRDFETTIAALAASLSDG
jgi:Fe-S-cluster containining protein